MGKELYTIIEKLKDVPEGICVNIRHPLGTSDIVKTASSEGMTDSSKLKSETYELYPGIELSFHCYLADHFHIRHCHGISVLSIDHCRAGRIGWEMKGGLSLYFGSGDLSFHYTDKCSDSEITLPLGYYEGLSIALDLPVLQDSLPELLNDAGVDVRDLCLKFCGDRETAALPASSRIEHIFSEVYDLPEQTKLPYLKLKCQELLMFLNMAEPAMENALDAHYSEQVSLIRQIHDQMTEHPEKRYTIDELAKEYLINTATLKSIFKSVYGMPVAAYMKHYRIMKAAGLLRNSSESIASVARAVGYESQSKFSAAFKDIMKILPTDYRRQYTHV